ncbi:hypothetical protein LTR53_007805 [Teratosphaeriaceae sp. CCFEE 6253]|nr:hypothetical protein LTR53_007805 [Teratosphaeriaceae sp. CCFEE 6253]
MSNKMMKSKAYFLNETTAGQIPCNGCHKFKPSSAYADAQLKALRAKIYGDRAFNPALREYVPCLTCKPSGQRFEFKCFGCDIIKARKMFAKPQLRNPDRPYCYPCSKARTEMEPGGASSDDDSDSSGSRESDNSDAGASDDEGVSTVNGAMSGVSLGGSTSFASSVSGGVKLDPPSSGIASYQSAGSARSSTPAASRELANLVSQASYVTGSMGATPRGPGSVANTQTSGNGAFPRVRAAPSRDVGRPQGKPIAKAKPTLPVDNGDDICVADSDPESD